MVGVGKKRRNIERWRLAEKNHGNHITLPSRNATPIVSKSLTPKHTTKQTLDAGGSTKAFSTVCAYPC